MTPSPFIVCRPDGQRQYHHCSYCDKSLCVPYTFNNGATITLRSAEPDEKLDGKMNRWLECWLGNQ